MRQGSSLSLRVYMTSDFILGPQLPIGDSYFDQTQIARGKVHGEACPATPPTDDAGLNSFILLNYYDLPLSLYIAHKRTNDPTFLTLARKAADSWWKHPTWIGEGTIRLWPDSASPPPRHAGIGGLILRALDGRPEMWDWIVGYTQAHLDMWCKIRIRDSQLYYGPREVAFSMQYAAWVAKTLPDSYPNAAQIRSQLIADLENLAVNYTGRLQYPDGSWRDSSEWVDNVFCALSADAPQGTTQLRVDPLGFPLSAGQKAAFWKGGTTKTTKAQPAGSTIVDVEPLSVSRIKGDFLTVDDGTTMMGAMQPFIVGLLVCALADVHQVVTNETVKENVKNQILKACRHLYSDGPYAKDLIEQKSGKRVRGFHYFYHGGTNLNPTKYEKGSMVEPWIDYEGWWVMAARQAIGTILPGFAYAYFLTQDPYFKSAYEEMYDSAYGGSDGFRADLTGTSKNLNQHCRRVPASLAWIGGTIATPAPAPTPSPTPSPTQTPSPDNTKAVSIVDSQGAVWTLGPQKQTLKNGVQAGGGQGSVYKYSSQVVYVLGMDNNWYKWSGSWSFVGSQEPGSVTPAPAPSPTPSPTPAPLLRKVSWPTGEAKQNAIVDTQWAERYRFKRHLSGSYAEFEKVP